MVTVNDLLDNLKNLLDKFYLRKTLTNSDEILITDSNKNITTTSNIAASKVSGLKTVATSGNYEDLTNKPAIPSAYTHPTYTAYNSGLYKITVNNQGHITSATQVQGSDLTSLGLLSKSTNVNNGVVVTNNNGEIIAASTISSDKVMYDTTSVYQHIHDIESTLAVISSATYVNGVFSTADPESSYNNGFLVVS